MTTAVLKLKIEPEIEPKLDDANGAAVIDSCQTVDPDVAALANDVIGRIADKWTMIILETLGRSEERRVGKECW